MDIKPQPGDQFLITVKPRSGNNAIVWDGQAFQVKTTRIPHDGQANDAVIALFKSILGWRVKLVNGFTSRCKRIEIIQVKPRRPNDQT